eukprot:15346556-Ditylum_brightwellii.AAC.2
MQQASPTENILKDTDMLIDYVYRYSNTKLHYFTGDMQLLVDSDVAYLMMPVSKRHYAGYFYLASTPNL